jgi:hypothetical protein
MYSGILRTFSSNFDVVLELPHRTDPPPSSQAVGLKIVADKMIFKFDSIVKIAAYETDLDSMTRSKWLIFISQFYLMINYMCLIIYRYIPNRYNN